MPPQPTNKKKQKLSKPAAPAETANGDEDKHEAFTRWARERGVTTNAVKAARLPGRGLGLITTIAVEEGVRLLFVPEKAMFKPDTKLLKRSELEQASPQAQLAACLMAQCKTPDSELSIWEATWPTDSDFEHSLPMRWAPAHRELLPPSVAQPLQRQEDDYRKDLVAVQDYLERSGWPVDGFRYYWSIVNSRSFHWKPRRGKSSMVMCPFIDYMNHGPSGTSCNVLQTPEGYEVTAERDYEAGEEVIATYGAHSNDKLLVHYGFICTPTPEEPNIDDDIRLDHLLLPALTEQVRSQLQDVGFLGAYALLPATNELCFKTQVAVRAQLLTANEWEYFMGNGEDMTEDQTPRVLRFMEPLLQQYREEAAQKLAVLGSRGGSYGAQEVQQSLLTGRWTQIIDGIDAFIGS